MTLKKYKKGSLMDTYLSLLLENLQQHRVRDNARTSFANFYETLATSTPSVKKASLEQYESQEFKDYKKFIDSLSEIYPQDKTKIIIKAFGETYSGSFFIEDYYAFSANRLDVLKEYSNDLFSSPTVFKDFFKGILKSNPENYYSRDSVYIDVIKERQKEIVLFLLDWGKKKNYFSSLSELDLMTQNEDFMKILKEENIIASEKLDLGDFEKLLKSYAKGGHNSRDNALNKMYITYFNDFAENFSTPQKFIDFKEDKLKVINKKDDVEKISYLMDEDDFFMFFMLNLKTSGNKEAQNELIKKWLKDESFNQKMLNDKTVRRYFIENKSDVFVEWAKENIQFFIDEVSEKEILKNPTEMYYRNNWETDVPSYRVDVDLMPQIYNAYSKNKEMSQQEASNLYDLLKDIYSNSYKILKNNEKEIEASILNSEEKENFKNSSKHMKMFKFFMLLNITSQYVTSDYRLSEENKSFLAKELLENKNVLENFIVENLDVRSLSAFSKVITMCKKEFDITEHIDMRKVMVNKLNKMASDRLYNMDRNFIEALVVLENLGLDSYINEVSLKDVFFDKDVVVNKKRKYFSDVPLLFTVLDRTKLFNEYVNENNLDIIKNTKYGTKNYIEHMLSDNQSDFEKKLLNLVDKPEIFNELLIVNKKANKLLKNVQSKELQNMFAVMENYFKVNKKLKVKEDPVNTSASFKI